MGDLSGLFKTGKKAKRETSKSFLHQGAAPSAEGSNGRLALISDARLHKITSNSLEKLSFTSDTESTSSNSEYENYDLEYCTYLLRSLQNTLLKKNKEEKEESIKKCLVSLKYEWEALLEEHVRLTKNLMYFKLFFDVLKQNGCRIKMGKKVLEILRENKFEVLFHSWSTYLEKLASQLRLDGISKAAIEEAFARNIFGSGSEIEGCLKSIEDTTHSNKERISRISAELLDIKKLSMENAVLRERCCALFNNVSTKILESNYQSFTDIVKNLFKKRQESSNEEFMLDDDDDLGAIQRVFQPEDEEGTSRESLQLSKYESISSLKPKNSSTPVPD